MIMEKRITTIVGAGAILDFDLPEGMPKPSTTYITDEVVKMEVSFNVSRLLSHIERYLNTYKYDHV